MWNQSYLEFILINDVRGSNSSSIYGLILYIELLCTNQQLQKKEEEDFFLGMYFIKIKHSTKLKYKSR
jgi:hypothetical protein